MARVCAVILDDRLCFHYKPLELAHIACLERYSAKKHCIKDNTCTPNVCFEAIATAPFQYFRSNVSWCTALFCEVSFPPGGTPRIPVESFTDTEIAELHLTALSVKEDIV